MICPTSKSPSTESPAQSPSPRDSVSSPTALGPFSAPGVVPTHTAAKITTHSSSIEPRSRTSPLLRFVRITNARVTSVAIHAQYNPAYTIAKVIVTSVKSTVTENATPSTYAGRAMDVPKLVEI